MSQQSSYSTEIRIYAQNVDQDANIETHPNMQILKKAVQLAAEDLGGEVTDRIVDCDGKETRCLLAIRTKEYPRGVGITLPKGKVVYIFDAYGDGREWGNKISSAVNRNYSVIAVMMAQEKLGYRIQVRESETQGHKKVVVSGSM